MGFTLIYLDGAVFAYVYVLPCNKRAAIGIGRHDAKQGLRRRLFGLPMRLRQDECVLPELAQCVARLWKLSGGNESCLTQRTFFSFAFSA